MRARERDREHGRRPQPTADALASARLDRVIGDELQAAFAEDLGLTLLRAFYDWCTANLAKTQSPHELMLGLGMFVQDAFASLWASTSIDEAAQAAYLRAWWQCVREGLPERQKRLLELRQAERLADREGSEPRRQGGPVARKLRLDLTRNIATPASFPFYVWPWQFMPKMLETGAMIRSMVAKKCRFWRIGEICTDVKSTMARQ